MLSSRCSKFSKNRYKLFFNHIDITSGVVPVTKRHWVSGRGWKYLEKLASCSVLYPTIYEMKKVPNGMLPIKNGF
mgnify:CR=1 FL=1